jgi:transcriptional regulator with PAS, ATPase and Fis domain
LLQEQQFERIGGHESTRTDVRLIAATNRDLEKMVSNGEFRGDLYFRLNVFSIRMPPLRDRGGDLRLLTNRFLKQFNREFKKQLQGIAPAAFDLLLRHQRANTHGDPPKC